MEPSFDEACKLIREALKPIEEQIKALHNHSDFQKSASMLAVIPDISEMHANIQLTVRHIEDARMRLGKAIQAADGGISVYPR